MPRNVYRVIVAISLHLAAVCSLCAQNQKFQSGYRFQHYNRDGLGDERLSNAVTDSLGYSWAFYSGGLSRYNGYKFEIFKYDEHDPARSALNFNIGKVWLDATGNIWLVGLLNNVVAPVTLVKYDWKTDHFIKYQFDVKGGVSAGAYGFEKDNSLVWVAKGGDQRSDQRSILRLDLKTGKAEEFTLPQTNTKQEPRNSINFLRNYDTCLLVATVRGLWLFGKKSGKFTRPPCKPEDEPLLYQSEISWMTNLKHEEKSSIWFKIRNGLFVKIDSNFSVVHTTDKVISGLNAFSTDDESIWYNHGDSGLFRYKVRDSSLTHIAAVPGDPYSLQSNRITDINVDRDMTIWIVYRDQGMSRVTKKILDYENLAMPEVHGSFVYQAGEKEYLILNQGKKLIMGEIGSHPDAGIEFQEVVPPLERGIVTGAWKGRKHLWMSIAVNGGVRGYPINAETNMIEPGNSINMLHDPANPNTIAGNMANAVWESSAGELWVAHVTKGISRINLNVPYGSDGSVIRYKNIEGDSSSLITDRVWSFLPEGDSSLWVITWDGVDLLHLDKGGVRFEHVFSHREVPNVLFRTSGGQLFLGTRNGLYLAGKENGRYVFHFQSIVGKKPIYSIQEDESGKLWLKGSRTLTYFDLSANTVLELNDQDGIDHLRSLSYANAEPHHGIHRTKNGMLIAVDPDGFTTFDPATLHIDRRPVVPLLTGLLVNNRAPQIGPLTRDDADYVIPSHISALSDLIIDYQHNNFIIEFSALQMTAPEKNRYSHKLEGYDDDWIETDYTNRTATYTNLPAGTYTFRVKSSNHLGIWSDQERTLKVIVLAPPWKTWWAYGLYGFAIIGLLLKWRDYDRRRLKLKHRAEHLAELDTLKTRFFTNISHEFRTPITLVLGPLKEMYNKAVGAAEKNTIGTMIRNGERLSALLTQLLDISKLEAGRMVLHASALDVITLMREISSSYEAMAVHKSIKFMFYPELKELNAFVDREKVETVVYNLLSNAFKFTPEGGEVVLHLKVQDKDWYQIIVKDSGIGIPVDEKEKIFDRFYQVDSSGTRNFEGSGLGMALARELVELHHGTIAVESESTSGSTFTVTLPIGREYFADSEIVDGNVERSDVHSDNLITITATDEGGIAETTSNVEQPVLLIVEDNVDMRQFIKKTLSDSYRVIECENGQEGLERALKEIPDLVISDVMMPVMDGFELCDKIKTNELTSHVSVILLTAKADHDSRMTGLKGGADDYIAKPFDADELRLVVRNRLEAIHKLRERFGREIRLEPGKIAITSLDEKFITKVMDIIEGHLADELFSIDDLAREVGYSNMHLYRKIKALSGQTPSVFLRTIRLKRAAALLEKDSDNVTQIAYSVGFSSLSYFSKCFKDQFGITPGQYGKEKVKQ